MAAPLYLSAPVNALLRGLYRSPTAVASVLRRGDFGLGTFNDLDGEMIVLDGSVFRVGSDGAVSPVDPRTPTPFACVTFFRPDSSEGLDGRDFAESFNGVLERLIPSPNLFYALRIDGDFSRVRVRAVSRQASPRPLVEAAGEQAEFVFENVSGTLAGFFAPDFMPALSPPGFHLHFLDADRKRGGHLLEVEARAVTVSLQHLSELALALPLSLDFLTADLDGDDRGELARAEGRA
ncbi:MAG TPA: acetolactate decarboxylase [bacterium]|nr:acetolactate decarboxylase [bacterium]HPQ66291.1 acetolactate decarboxylase [bacterium]